MLHEAPSGIGLEENIHELPLVFSVGIRCRRNLLFAERLESPLAQGSTIFFQGGRFSAQTMACFQECE